MSIRDLYAKTKNIATTVTERFNVRGNTSEILLNNARNLINSGVSYSTLRNGVQIRPYIQTPNRLQNISSPHHASINPERATHRKQGAPGILSFPSDRSGKYKMGLIFKKYQRPDGFSKAQLYNSNQANIFLPMPEAIIDAHGIQWDPSASGAIGQASIGAGGDVMQAVANFFGDIGKGVADTKRLTGEISSALGGQNVDMDFVRSMVTGGSRRALDKVIGGIDGELAGTVNQFMGSIPNPHMSVFFQGINLRTFDFRWVLAPRNIQDSKNLKKIIKTLKMKALPRKSDGIASELKYPDIVIPQFFPNPDKLFMFKKCAISGISVDYTHNGGAAFFGKSGGITNSLTGDESGYPMSVALTISLQEIEYFTSQDEEEGIDNAP